MGILINMAIYIFLATPLILYLVKLYEYLTSDEFGDNVKWKKAGMTIYIMFLIFFLLVLGAVLIFKNLWKIRYENYLVIAQICLTMTLIFCYFFSKFRKKKAEIDIFITRYILLYIVPFLFLILNLRKII